MKTGIWNIGPPWAGNLKGRSTALNALGLSVFLIVSLMGPSTALACSPWWHTYKPDLPLFGVSSSPADQPLLNQSIEETLRGWQELIETKDAAALKALVYDTTLEQITALRASALIGSDCRLAQENPVAASLIRERRLDVLDYLVFLRQSEVGFPKPDAWAYGQKQALAQKPDQEISHFKAVLAEAEKALLTDPPAALKRRYVYQMFNFGFRAEIPEYNEKLKNLFAAEVAAWPDGEPVKEWCRSYYAGLLYNEGDLTGAFKEYARVYDQSRRCRERAHTSLHLILKKDAEAGLKTLARPDLTEAERKAVQKVLNSFNADLEEVLVAALEKGWALPRDIDRRLAGYLNAENDRRLSQPAPYIPEPQSGLEKTLAVLAETHTDRALMLLAATNMAIQRGDAAAARGYLRQADRADHEGRHEAQRVVLKTLNRAYLEPLHDRGEAELFDRLSWLIERGGQSWRRPFEYGRQKTPADETGRLNAALRSILWTILPDRYTAQSRDDRAALIMAALDDGDKTGPYVSSFSFWKLIQSPPSRLRALADTLESPRTPFEKFLTGSVTWTPDYPLELAGSYYIRTHRFGQAAGVLARIPAERRRPWTVGSKTWRERVYSGSMPGAGNPFENPFFFSHGIERTVADIDSLEEALIGGLPAELRARLKRLTEAPADRLDFARQMKQLEELGREPGELGALALYRYALGVYNTSWHGRNWRMSAWGHSSLEMSYATKPSKGNPYFWLSKQIRRYAEVDPDDQYHFPSAAVKDLKRALTKTHNQELKARLELTLAAMPPTDPDWWRAYQQQDYTQQMTQLEQHFETQREDLRTLAARYEETEFVRQARESCPRLQDFL